MGFLRKFLFGGIIVLNIPMVAVAFPGQIYYDPISNECAYPDNGWFLGLFFVVVYVVILIALALLIWHSKDVYKIKSEFAAQALVWIIAVSAFAAYSKPPKPSQRTFSACAILVVGNTISLLLANGLPLYYGRFERVDYLKDANSLEHFRRLLELIQFRDTFHEFLAKQFCQENLQFYEVVTHWKSLALSDPSRKEKLRSIIDVFVVDDGVCQVHIHGPPRAKIMEDGLLDEPPSTIFDDALESLIADMHLNSYLQFLSTKHPVLIPVGMSNSHATNV